MALRAGFRLLGRLIGALKPRFAQSGGALAHLSDPAAVHLERPLHIRVAHLTGNVSDRNASLERVQGIGVAQRVRRSFSRPAISTAGAHTSRRK